MDKTQILTLFNPEDSEDEVSMIFSSVHIVGKVKVIEFTDENP